MAGTATVTTLLDWRRPSDNRINLITVHWTTSSEGAYVLDVVDGSGATIQFNGTLLRLGFAPDDDAQPTDAYDVTAASSIVGLDVFGGLGANLSNAAASADTPLTGTNSMPIVLAGAVTITINNAGNSTSGYIYMYIR